VELVEYSGARRAIGFNMLTMGSTTGKWDVKLAVDKANSLDFATRTEAEMQAEAKAAVDIAKKAAGKKKKGGN
jgi:hypothetical protein